LFNKAMASSSVSARSFLRNSFIFSTFSLSYLLDLSFL
jgi:hypothetical protein